MKKTILWSAILSLLFVSLASADVRLPKMFTNNCVLQRDAAVQVFGYADAGEKVTVEFNGQKVETTASGAGKWIVSLAPMPAKSEGSTMTVTGKNVVTVENVVVGEVWVCGGQSNMQYPVGGWGRVEATEDELNGDNSFIRFLRDPYITNPEPQDDLGGGAWTLCKDGACLEDILANVFTHYGLEMNVGQHALVGSTVRSYLSYLADAGKITLNIDNNHLVFKEV